MELENQTPIEKAQAAADANRLGAKRLLGQFIIDQGMADQIVDRIINAAVLEVSVMLGDVFSGARRG